MPPPPEASADGRSRRAPSIAWAASRISDSLNAGPAICRPDRQLGPAAVGRRARPDGIEIAGMPASDIGTVQ